MHNYPAACATGHSYCTACITVQFPVDEIPRAVSGAVTSVLNKISVRESEGGEPGPSQFSGSFHEESESDDFLPPRTKKTTTNKGKYVQL